MPDFSNVDSAEIKKFESVSMRWWDKNGEFRALHDMNPIRLDYIAKKSHGLDGKKVLDVGCGGGILSESMALAGAEVTGIDMGQANLSVARLHLYESGARVDYQHITVEALAEQETESYDIVTCMEMLEHVPNPASIIQACARLVKPAGHVFFSTINRNLKAWGLAVIGAEYIIKLLPRGTHQYQKFIRPSELDGFIRSAGMRLVDIQGVHYNPFSRRCQPGSDVSINYMVHCYKDETN